MCALIDMVLRHFLVDGHRVLSREIYLAGRGHMMLYFQRHSTPPEGVLIHLNFAGSYIYPICCFPV